MSKSIWSAARTFDSGKTLSRFAMIAGAIVMMQSCQRAAQVEPDRSVGAPAPARVEAAPEPRVIKPVELTPGLIVLPDESIVQVSGIVCLDAGWLEQIACSPSTREHESLVVIKVRPSAIHAAMLMAGFKPGTPGSWTYENESLQLVAPTGDHVAIDVQYADAQAHVIREPIQSWVSGPTESQQLPSGQWIFGGSKFASRPASMGPGEFYVADMSGSIIGLVTFGDELIGYSQVISDSAEIQEPQWQVRVGHVPPLGTPVTLIIHRP